MRLLRTALRRRAPPLPAESAPFSPRSSQLFPCSSRACLGKWILLCVANGSKMIGFRTVSTTESSAETPIRQLPRCDASRNASSHQFRLSVLWLVPSLSWQATSVSEVRHSNHRGGRGHSFAYLQEACQLPPTVSCIQRLTRSLRKQETFLLLFLPSIHLPYLTTPDAHSP